VDKAACLWITWKIFSIFEDNQQDNQAVVDLSLPVQIHPQFLHILISHRKNLFS